MSAGGNNNTHEISNASDSNAKIVLRHTKPNCLIEEQHERRSAKRHGDVIDRTSFSSSFVSKDDRRNRRVREDD